MILSRKKAAAMPDAEPISSAEPVTINCTARELAEKVRRPAAHQLLEHKLSGLRDSAKRLMQRMLEARESSMLQGSRDATLKAIGLEQTANDEALRACRVELAPYRQRHALAVETALAPMRTEVAGKVAAAADTLRAALADLNVVHSEARRFGVDAPSVVVRGLDDVADQLKGII